MLPSDNLDIIKKNAEIVESGRALAKVCIEVPVVCVIYELRCVSLGGSGPSPRNPGLQANRKGGRL